MASSCIGRGKALSLKTTASINVEFSTTTGCPNANIGLIRVTNITGGTAPYQVNLDDGPNQLFPPQPPATFIDFDNVPAGEHTINVTDSNGKKAKVPAAAGVIITFKTKPACPNETDGEIIIEDITGGDTPLYIVTVDGGPFEIFPPVPPQNKLIFSGLTAGEHTIQASFVGGRVVCVRTVQAKVCPCKVKRSHKSKKALKAAKLNKLAKEAVLLGHTY